MYLIKYSPTYIEMVLHPSVISCERSSYSLMIIFFCKFYRFVVYLNGMTLMVDKVGVKSFPVLCDPKEYFQLTTKNMFTELS